MALNGYEIGIQRKIKPADHIQSMADKIQDTVVTKHPLNSDTPSGENSREGTLKRHVNKSSDKIYKYLENNVPAISTPQNTGQQIINNNLHAPIPPPLPTTPIPSLQAHSTPIIHALNAIPIPNTYYESKVEQDGKLENSHGLSNEKPINGDSSSDSKDKIDHGFVNNILKKKEIEKAPFLKDINTTAHKLVNNSASLKEDRDNKSNISNNYSRRKLFENNEPSAERCLNQEYNKTHNNICDTYLKKNNIIDKSVNKENVHDSGKKKDNDSQSLLHNLQDNSLYSLKSKIITNQNGGSDNELRDDNNSKTLADSNDTKFNTSIEKDDTNDVVVRRRDRKNKRNNDDGRRDSRIIARPLSTMTSTDVSEGQYPVCHKCDKAITR